MTAKVPDKLSLEIKRVIKAPRDRVYAAWTDPAQLREWFGPENVQTRSLVAEARMGGKFRWDLTSSDGEKMTVRGEYRELQPDRKIVFTSTRDSDKNQIYVMNTDGTNILRLTTDSAVGYFNPMWSPDSCKASTARSTLPCEKRASNFGTDGCA